jgi:recombination protein RecT
MASQALQRTDDAPNDYRRLATILSNRATDFQAALPAHITPDKFQRTILTAAQSNPDLLAADRASLVTSCMKAAQDGLLPDGREAALVVYSVRKKEGNQWVSVKTVQYLPMAFGLRKKILQSGEISSLETNVVYKAELESGAFIYEAGTEAVLRHRPDLQLEDADCTDDNIVAAYSVATMKDGTKSFEVMRRSEINKVRQASQTGAVGKTKYNSNEAILPKGPWVDWFSEMARKTVMRRHSKTLPMSGDVLIDVEARDDELHARSVSRVLATEPEAALPMRIEAEERHDPETGEVRDTDDEEVARDLDRQHDAMENDPEDGGPSLADQLIAKVEGAEVIADVIMIENEYRTHGRDMLEVEDQDRVEAVIDSVKKALKKGSAK